MATGQHVINPWLELQARHSALIIGNMDTKPIPPKTIAIAAHPQLPAAETLAQEIADFLTQEPVKVTCAPLYDQELQQQIQDGMFDMLVALGGDGTMLRAGGMTAASKVPVLGINVGRFGFLTAVQGTEWRSTIKRLLRGDYWLEDRMMLHVEHFRENEQLGAWEVVNECTIGRGKMVRPVRLTTEVDDHFLTTYVADALIVSTPTGSTAYALAAGGPILPPELRNILIVPVAPHLSVDRAIVLHEGSWVRVTVRTDHEASLTMDGQPSVEMLDGDCVWISAGQHVVQFVRLQSADYFYRNLTSRMNQNPSAGER